MARRHRPRRLVVLGVALAVSALAGGVFWYAGRGVSPPATREQAAVPEAGPAERTLPDGKSDFAAAFRAGLRNFQKGDAHAAARAFEKALAIRPHAVQARVNLGFAYVEMGRPAEARHLFSRAIEIAPMTANAYYGLGEALEAEGDIPGAIGAMRSFLHLSEGSDHFRRRARAALWEWEALRESRPAPALEKRATVDGEDGTGPAGEGATGIALLDAPLQMLDGKPVTLARHRGKIMVLNVWATWCGPCRVELPSLDRLRASLDPGSFAVLGVSIDEKRAFVGEYLRDVGVSLQSYWDPTGNLTGGLLGTRAVPLTLVISKEGRVLAGYEGARDWSAPELVAAIRGIAEGTAPHAARLARLRVVLRWSRARATRRAFPPYHPGRPPGSTARIVRVALA